MTDDKFDFDETVTVREYASGLNPPRSPQWVYVQIANGMPVIRTGERCGMRIHPPSVNLYWLGRMKGRRRAPSRST